MQQTNIETSTRCKSYCVVVTTWWIFVDCYTGWCLPLFGWWFAVNNGFLACLAWRCPLTRACLRVEIVELIWTLWWFFSNPAVRQAFVRLHFATIRIQSTCDPCVLPKKSRKSLLEHTMFIYLSEGVKFWHECTNTHARQSDGLSEVLKTERTSLTELNCFNKCKSSKHKNTADSNGKLRKKHQTNDNNWNKNIMNRKFYHTKFFRFWNLKLDLLRF